MSRFDKGGRAEPILIDRPLCPRATPTPSARSAATCGQSSRSRWAKVDPGGPLRRWPMSQATRQPAGQRSTPPLTARIQVTRLRDRAPRPPHIK
jgi:hypothetical protein